MNTTLKLTFRAVLVLSWFGWEAMADPASTKYSGSSQLENADVSTNGEFDDGEPLAPEGDDSRELLGLGDNWAANGTNIYNTNLGKVGIGTATPAAKLHVIGDVYSDGTNGVYARNPNNVSAVAILGWLNNLARIRIGGDGAGATNGLDIQTTGNRSLMRLLHGGNVGIGTTSPAHKLDVAGRMRVRQNTPAQSGNTAGIWLYQEELHEDRAFVGMRNNSQVGLYGRTAGWRFLMDVINGNFLIGATGTIAPSGPRVSLIAGNQVGLGVLNNSAQTTATFRNNGSGQAALKIPIASALSGGERLEFDVVAQFLKAID